VTLASPALASPTRSLRGWTPSQGQLEAIAGGAEATTRAAMLVVDQPAQLRRNPEVVLSFSPMGLDWEDILRQPRVFALRAQGAGSKLSRHDFKSMTPANHREASSGPTVTTGTRLSCATCSSWS
jgi:hypothetical protein